MLTIRLPVNGTSMPSRQRIEAAIESLLALLDEADGDPDLEPSLGYQPYGVDLEPDLADDRYGDAREWDMSDDEPDGQNDDENENPAFVLCQEEIRLGEAA